MSSIHNRIVTTYSASAGNAIAVQGQIAAGMLNIGRSAVQGGRGVSAMENQLRALGTTIRYALAGTAVFAIPSAIRNLSQLQQQLGLMSAIGQGPGGIPIVGQQLRDLGTDAQAGAVAAITPINDFNSAVVNFLSTVQNVPPNEVVPIVTDIARAARLAQIPVEDATKAFTTMSIAFGRTPDRKRIHTTAQQFFALTQLAPGGASAGGQIVGQLGQLAQVTRLAGGTESNLFALLLSGLRTGIPPSQLGRGLQYLIQTVGLPGQQTKSSQQALSSVGIRSGTTMPLMERITRIFNKARTLSGGNIPNINRFTHLDEDTLDQLDATGNTNDALKSLGITGPGASFLGQVFHRVHALRTALALLGQFDVGRLQQDLHRSAQIEQGHIQDINKLSKAWERFRNQAKLSEAGVSLQRLGLQIAQDFQPLFNLGAKGATGLSSEAARHPRATRDIAYGGAGLLGAYGLARFFGARGLPSLFGRGILGKGLPAVAAVESLTTGEMPKGTAASPFFVIVMGQVFGPRGTMQYPSPIGPQNRPMGGGRGFPLGLGPGLIGTAAVTAIMATSGDQASNLGKSGSWLKRHYPSLFAMGVRDINPHGGFVFREGTDEKTIQYLSQLHGKHSTGEINRIVRDRLTRIYTNQGGSAAGMSASAIAIALQGRVTLDIDYNQPDGTTKRKKVHVRVDNWGNGNAPQHRGKNRTNRR